MKKAVYFICFVLIIFLLFTACGGNPKIDIDYGNSNKFSEDEIKAAVDCVIENFLTDCKLTKIWYDEIQSASAAESYITYGKGKKNGVKMENVIVIFTDFTAPSNSAVFSPNQKMKNYNWILIRDNAGDPWEIDDRGY